MILNIEMKDRILANPAKSENANFENFNLQL
jgi:hypothetical protein